MKVVYIAAPFMASSAWAIEQNIRRVEEAGYAVAEMGASPLMPHANSRFFVGTFTPEFWYEATLALLSKSDALLLIGDWHQSRGACAEHRQAMIEKIPIFVDLADLSSWLGRAPS
jgi:hypothetical protein